jgi:pyruvate/2-oxoglutarate dehydrogenase complex dihydrolipoamide acyltransferase (E2) component
MPLPLHIPRINNNDDEVRIAAVAVEVGAFVAAGQAVLEIESDKAVVAVEAEAEGYVLDLLVAPGEMAKVGSIALWLGASAAEPVPDRAAAEAPAAEPAAATTTAKARLLLARHGLSEAEVPRAGPRLTAADVEAFLAAGGAPRGARPEPAEGRAPALPAPARLARASPARRGMVASVAWQRDQASATYLECLYDPGPWERYASAFAKAHRLLMSPLLPLLAWRLVGIAAATPAINATVIEAGGTVTEVVYETVNLGFTVQAGDQLYLTVVHDAARLDEAGFVARLGELQRRAIARKLEPRELEGATIGFSSMARWEVSRHVPILAPWTAVMVAHTVFGSGEGRQGVLGITYDHRVLSGFEAARILRTLAVPPDAPGA